MENKSVNGVKTVLQMIKNKQISAYDGLEMIRSLQNDMANEAGLNEPDMKKIIIDNVKKILNISNEKFDPSLQFVDYGIDSILGLELVNSINSSLNIELKQTILFDYPTIETLEKHIRQNFSTVIKPVMYENIKPIIQKEIPEKKVVSANNLFGNHGINAENSTGFGSNIPVYNKKSGLDDKVAIIGIAGQFSGAENLEEYWKNISNGVDSIIEIPEERWDIDKYYDSDPANLTKTYCRDGGFLSNIKNFDPLFFNISGKEAELTDPQHRLFLKECWNVLEDAAYSAEALKGRKVGVFVGVDNGDYVNKMLECGIEHEPQSYWGNDTSIIPGRIAYFLDLKGPCASINTACSSSLVAVHMGCQSLITGDSEIIIAGGVHVSTTPTGFISTSNSRMLSPEGRCKTFDDSANGFVPGEGVAVVLLKLLKNAIRDKDNIYAIINASGVNYDGKTNGIMAPSSLAQSELEIEVYTKAGINPETIDYVEAHGTGTKLGDPIEVEALTMAFGKFTKKLEFCAIGSVKTNIGHAAEAAGVAGLIKVILSMKNRKIPPSLHFTKPNRNIKFEKTPFYVNTELKEWIRKPGHPRRSVISAFGFSGTNAHVLIDEYSDDEKTYSKLPYYIITLSAKNEKSLNRRIADMFAWLQTNYNKYPLINLSFTLLQGRTNFPSRCAFVVRDWEDLKGKILQVSNNIMGITDFYINKSGELKYEQSSANYGNTLIDELSATENMDYVRFKERMNELSDLFVKGCDLDWTQFFSSKICNRISMPTYPFNEKVYWINDKKKSSIQESNLIRDKEKLDKLHPMVWKRSDAGNEIAFITLMTGKEFFLSDHIVNEDILLPGVGYLEIAAACGSMASGGQMESLRNVLWLRPLIIKNKPIEVITRLKKCEGLYEFEIYSISDNKDKIVYCRGELAYRGDTANLKSKYDIDEIKSRMHKITEGSLLFPIFNSVGLKLGKSFRVLKHVGENDSELLTEIGLPEHLKADFGRFTLHPSIMDGAFQTAMLLIMRKASIFHLPFAVNRVEIIKPLSENCYVYIDFSRDVVDINSKIKKVDINVLNENGELSVFIEGYIARPLSQEQISCTTEKEKKSEERFLYIPRWEPVEIKNQSKTVLSGVKSLIVYSEENKELHKALLGLLSGQKVFSLFLGNKNEKKDEFNREIITNDKEAIGDYIKSFSSSDNSDTIDNIYFISGFQSGDVSYKNMKAFYNATELSIHSFFRLVKALETNDYVNNPLKIIVITNKVHSIISDDLIFPDSACLNGFCMSLSKEYVKWKINCIDLSIENNEYGAIPEYLSTADDYGQISIRDDIFYRRVLYPLTLPADTNSRFKKGGVYFIAGGAGGIGLALAEYLSENYNANLILVGRKDLSDEQSAKISAIESKGGKVLYLKADITEPKSLTDAVRMAKKLFGKINGVIHSAIVLNDCMIKKMDEIILDSSLSPKTYGAINLYNAFAGDDLEFVLFFSSIQSFIGNKGQSNYTAGCLFIDAFVEFWSRNKNYPVRNINWGYWGSIGVVASDEYNKILKLRGFNSIEPSKGFSAIEKILSSSVKQVVAIDAQDKLLQNIGVDFNYSLDLVPEKLPDMISRIKFPESELMKNYDENEIKRCLESFLVLEKYSQAMLLSFFMKNGFFNKAGSVYDFYEIKKNLEIIPEYDRLFGALIDILINAGFIDGNLRTLDKISETNLSSYSNGREDLSIRYPMIKAHINLISTVFESFSEILSGRKKGTNILFPGGSLDLVKDIYKGNPLNDAYNILIASCVEEFINNLLSDFPKSTFKILEVGAGTGSATGFILDLISKYDGDISYYYTDVSIHFLNYGRKHFGINHKFIEFKTLDIERNPVDQDFQSNGFDIIIASNVIHATKHVSKVLNNLKGLLKKNGILLIFEVTGIQDFSTLTFGLTSGWWQYEDVENRIPHSPLLSLSKWKNVLNVNGFGNLKFFNLANDPGKDIGQYVILAESDGIIKNESIKIDSEKSLKNDKSGFILDGKSMILRKNEFESPLKEYIRNVFSEVLKIDREDIIDNSMFENYGLDSLLVVEINRKFEMNFGKLPVTLLFEYATVERLTGYFMKEHGEAVRNVFGSPTNNVQDKVEYEYLDGSDHSSGKVIVDEKTGNHEHELKEYIRNVFSEVLKIDREDIIDNSMFENYGLDSLLVVEINRKFEINFGKLPVTLLFEYATVERLTGYFMKEYKETVVNVFSSDEIKDDLNVEDPPSRKTEENAEDSIVDRFVDSLSGKDVDALLDKLYNS